MDETIAEMARLAMAMAMLEMLVLLAMVMAMRMALATIAMAKAMANAIAMLAMMEMAGRLAMMMLMMDDYARWRVMAMLATTKILTMLRSMGAFSHVHNPTHEVKEEALLGCFQGPQAARHKWLPWCLYGGGDNASLRSLYDYG